MENLKNSMMEYWLVKVGNLYYAGGLDRNFPEDEEAKSFEFTTLEDVAFMILEEDIANNVAKLVGGIVVPKENTLEEANKLLIMHEKYIVSSDIEKGTLESIKEVYKSRKEDLDKAYISQCVNWTN
ncbi:hypothetical protein [Clostridium butyricum]|uniref:hypothetical protein n=1 Tax=Clostridium butyricum TaxID=1492 RepID=UPI0022DFAE22|nr:hypothetical protein [Clostridium butyricum]